ncbi:MAG TPA: hypothetical protein VMG80_07115, partial [Solirubrobacteraceae bacterium]|nr:hypothetical protein [Solirubrobacteraceae bacterium]
MSIDLEATTLSLVAPEDLGGHRGGERKGGPGSPADPGSPGGAGVAYRPSRPYLDELFEEDGSPRPAVAPLVAGLERLGPEGLIEAGRRRDAVFMQQGITFETSSE